MMRTHSTWEVFLPLNFFVGNKFKKAPLSQFVFEIDGVRIELLRKEADETMINRLRIDLYQEYDERYLPSHEHHEYLSNFINLVTSRAGVATQKFLDGFSRNTTDEEHKIFDGDDFLTRYKFRIEPHIASGSGNNRGRAYNLDDKILTKSINFAKKQKGVLDNSWYLIRDAGHSIELGKYEISLIYMAIVSEFLIKSALSRYLNNNGYFKSPHHEENVKNLFGENASFADRYYLYGLTLLTNKKLPHEVLEYIDFIYKIRNKLAHGKQLFEINLLKQNGINESNIRGYLYDFLNNVTEVHNFLFDLNCELNFWTLS